MTISEITDKEIEDIEALLLPEGCHFQDDALRVIRHWSSADVSACPGSGKTTVLLAKLKLLADRMPFVDGSGICVLSHTNVAVNEIKRKFAGYVGKIEGYPNYVGTIQSFIDRFVTLPYIRRKYGHTVRPVDDRAYSRRMINEIQLNKSNYYQLYYKIDNICKNSGGNTIPDMEKFIGKLYLDVDGSLYAMGQNKCIASGTMQSAQQFKALTESLLHDEEIMRYRDTIKFANDALDEFHGQYTDLFSKRFGFVFVDEYQDCTAVQRDILNKIFDPAKCVVFHLGDPDQAIYNSDGAERSDWILDNGYLSISSTCRYPQEIADILSPLKKDQSHIFSLRGNSSVKPVLIIYDDNTIHNVLGEFILLLEKNDLYDVDGIYKAIGYIRNNEGSGKSIGSYWDEFDSQRQMDSYLNYWGIIDEISSCLEKGHLYEAEALVRVLFCRMLHYADVKTEAGKKYTASSLNTALKDRHFDVYSKHILKMSQLTEYTRQSIDAVFRDMLDDVFNKKRADRERIFKLMPSHFMEELAIMQKNDDERNVFVEPLRGRKIRFDTIHGVKGETHDATLYLETSRQNGTDIGRILNRYGVGKPGESPLFDYSRKIAYVGMSRPKKLLCVAIRDKTYSKGKNAFLNWEIKDIRK